MIRGAPSSPSPPWQWSMRDSRQELGKVFYMKTIYILRQIQINKRRRVTIAAAFAIEDTVNGVFQAPINSRVAGASRCYWQQGVGAIGISMINICIEHLSFSDDSFVGKYSYLQR